MEDTAGSLRTSGRDDGGIVSEQGRPADAPAVTAPAPPAVPGGPRHAARRRPLSRWVGVIGFATAVMVFLGLWNVLDGLIALFNDEYFLVTPDQVLLFDLTAWGLVLLVLGGVQIVAGLVLLTGAMWARIVTAVVAALNALVQLFFVAVYPIGALIIMALGILVIWAVLVHGGELRD
jgi:hypothetical protein